MHPTNSDWAHPEYFQRIPSITWVQILQVPYALFDSGLLALGSWLYSLSPNHCHKPVNSQRAANNHKQHSRSNINPRPGG